MNPQTGGVLAKRVETLADTDTNLYTERTCAMDSLPYAAKNGNSSPRYTYDQPIWVRLTSYDDPIRGTFIKYNPRTVQVRIFPRNDTPYVKNVHISFVSPRLAVADYWIANTEQKQLVLAMLRDLYPITFHREEVSK